MSITTTKTLTLLSVEVRVVTTKQFNFRTKQSVTEHIKEAELDAFPLVALLAVMCSHRAGKLRRNPINKVNNSPLLHFCYPPQCNLNKR